VTKKEGTYTFLYLTRGDIHLTADKIRLLKSECSQKVFFAYV
jgi:hypothetical protein